MQDRGLYVRSEASEVRLVLIAERDPHVRELQRFFLERAAFKVEHADDGPSALEQARTVRPVVIVTEILLPGLDGLALCRRLREDPLTRDIPIVIFSMLAAASRAAEAGAQVFLRKPLVESTFLAAIHDAIATQPTRVTEQQ